MKSILVSFVAICFSIFFTNALMAQQGPGGVGNSINNILWLDASQLSLLNGNDLSSWTDLSKNNNHAIQGLGASQPTFRTNQVNGFPAVSFDGNDDFLNLTTDITSEALTAFIIYEQDIAKRWNGLLSTNNAYFAYRNDISRFYDYSSWSSAAIRSRVGFSLFSSSVAAGTSASIDVTSDDLTTTQTRAGFFPNTSSAVGYRQKGSTHYANGFIPEIILYNEKLNSAEKNIVLNSLAAKYDLTTTSNLYAFKTSYNNGVIGVGQEADGSNTTAQGRDSLIISNATSLGNGDYILVGNNNGGYGTTGAAGSGFANRWNQVWRVDKTGTPGNVDLEFRLGSSSFATADEYILVIENIDGNFSNGGTTALETGKVFTASPASVKFTNIDLPDGAYFTIAKKIDLIKSVISGDWNDGDTWDCSCIPTPTDSVDILNGHTVTISNPTEITDVFVNGTLSFPGSDTLSLTGDLKFENGDLVAGEGTIFAKSTSISQSFSNSSSNRINFNNLYVNNKLGVLIQNGGWSITGNLQVTDGGLNVTSADSVVIVSTAAKTAQILESKNQSITGNFVVQRFISARNANYANLSSPISNGTVADLDDDLILSGVGGRSGNAVNAGIIFRSVFYFNNTNSRHISVLSTSRSLVVSRGYEVFLADDKANFNGATVDFRGNITNGSQNALSTGGWNFYGNPFQSFISFEDIKNSAVVPDEYYIFNANSGSYDLYNTLPLPDIAPGQGFWVDMGTNPTNSTTFRFTEQSKVSSNSSAFNRQANRFKDFSLKLSSNLNEYSHQLRLNFDILSTSELDERDAQYLPSPLIEVPAITSTVSNSKLRLVYNSLNPLEASHSIAISTYAGIEGEYKITADNFEAIYDNYDCIYLKDNENDITIDVSVDRVYSFSSKVGRSERFELILSNDYNECQKLLETPSTNQNLSDNISLRNAYGNWYVDYEFGESLTQVEVYVYNMNGQEVKVPVFFTAKENGSFQINSLERLNGIFLIQIKSNQGIISKIIKL